MKEVIVGIVFTTLATFLALKCNSWYAIGLQVMGITAIIMWQVASYKSK